MSRIPLTLTVLLLLAPGVVGDSLTFEVIVGGQSMESNGFAISGGHSYVRTRYPAVTFGMAQAPAGTWEFTYFVLSKFHEDSRKIPRVDCNLDVNGSEARDKSTIEVKGKKLTLAYTVRINRGITASEELTVNGKKVDLRNGRVFLVDFSKEEVTWVQVKAGLPAHPREPRKTAMVKSLAKQIVEQLRKDNGSVQDFLK